MSSGDGPSTPVIPEHFEPTLREQAELLDLARDAIMMRDMDGVLCYWNQGAEKVYGWARDAALGQHCHTLLHTRFPQPPTEIEADVLRTGYWEGELAQIRQDGTPVIIASRWTVRQNTHDPARVILEINTDITARKQIELSRRLLAEAGQALAHSLDPATQLTHIAQVATPLLADWCTVHIVTTDQKIQLVAVAPAKLQSLDLDATLGVAHVLHTGQPEFYPEASDELRPLGLKSAMIVPLVTRGHTLGALTLAVTNESGRWYTMADLALAEELAQRTALAVDNARLYDEAQRLNTELEARVAQRTAQLERSQAQLLHLAHHEQTAREEERTRIAREIHDELGQDLTGIKMDLAWLQKHIHPKQKDLVLKFAGMFALLDDAIQSVRRIATELRPGILDDLGLLAAMEWQLQEFEKRTGIHCQFTTNVEEVALDADGVTALFRVFQETLTNVVRHANANWVEVALDQEQGIVSLRVQDDGRGITEGEIDGAKSYGLLGMRERVRLRNGDFSIRRMPGRGTMVIARLPLSKPEV